MGSEARIWNFWNRLIQSLFPRKTERRFFWRRRAQNRGAGGALIFNDMAVPRGNLCVGWLEWMEITGIKCNISGWTETDFLHSDPVPLPGLGYFGITR